MANLPDQLKKQVEEAEATLEQLNQSVTDSDDTTGETGQEPEGETQHTENVESIQTATAPENENSDTYAQRWRTLQGSYNAVMRQKQAQDQRIAQLEQILSTMQQPTQQQTQQPAQQPTSLLTEQEISDFGDSIGVMRKAAKEELTPYFNQIQQQLEQLSQGVSNQVQQVSRSQTATRAEMFWQKLQELVPDWEAINQSPGFQQWLSEVDPQTGMQRQIYLDDAQRRFDVNRVAFLFRAGSGKQQQAASEPTPSPETVTESAVSTELQKQIQPGKTKEAPTPVDKQQGKMWSRAEIIKFYDEVRRGVYLGKEAQRDEIEKDIITAAGEGRVQ